METTNIEIRILDYQTTNNLYDAFMIEIEGKKITKTIDNSSIKLSIPFQQKKEAIFYLIRNETIQRF